MIIKKVMPKIPVAKKRVAAYCRVSTFRNEQDESFETQQKYYEELIQSHPDWELVKVYADRHSATRVKNRPGFQEMAAAAEAKKLDIIICKSISRFSRNMVDCQQYAKWFRTLGVTIIFEEQNIRTDDPTCDFVLSILAAVAQDESHSISENEKAAYLLQPLSDAVRAVFLHVLHQRVVVILTHRRRAVLHGFAAARKVRNNILRSGPSCVVVIQTEDDFADSREILQKRIQCRIVRAAQRQIMDTAPWPRVLHELRFCEKHLGDAIERELLGLTAVKVVKLHGCFSQKCALE